MKLRRHKKGKTRRVPRARKPYAAPLLTAWQKRALETGSFEHMVPPFREVPTSQAAFLLTLSVDSVLALVERGALEARVKQIKGTRRELSITTRSILLHIVSTWTLDPHEIELRLVHLVKTIRNRRCLLAVKMAVDAEIERATPMPR
jgi:hypothetical protein